MNKALLYWIAYNVVILTLSGFILAGAEPSRQFPNMTGMDAFNIAATRVGYWIPIIIGFAVSIGLIIYAIRSKMTHAGALHFIAFVPALAIALLVYIPVAQIKADPIGHAATTEQIEYLRSKGMDK